MFSPIAADNPRMAEHVYKKIEIVGSSPNGMEEAVHNALSRASKTIRNMRWFEVTETRGYIDEGKIEHWQVTLKIGFTLEEYLPVRRFARSAIRPFQLATLRLFPFLRRSVQFGGAVNQDRGL